MGRVWTSRDGLGSHPKNIIFLTADAYGVLPPVAKLTPEQSNRYKRHLLLPEVGVEGQAKLLDAKVLMLGAGGLGSPVALYLAAAGVGHLMQGLRLLNQPGLRATKQAHVMYPAARASCQRGLLSDGTLRHRASPLLVS